MGKAAKILLGSMATALVTVGIAAQTGTVRWPDVAGSRTGNGGVQAQEATSSPSPTIAPSRSPSPQPTQAPAPQPSPQAPGPPPHKKHGH